MTEPTKPLTRVLLDGYAYGGARVFTATSAERAERLIACWNALEGLNPEGVGELVEAARAIVSAQSPTAALTGTIYALRAALANITGEDS